MDNAKRRADVPLVRRPSGGPPVIPPVTWVDIWGIIHVVDLVQTFWIIRCDCDTQGSYQELSTAVPTCLRCVARRPRR